MSTLTITIARDSDGALDLDGTLVACEAAFHKYVAERDTENATVSAAVEQTFDQMAGGRANMPFVVNNTLRLLNVQSSNYNQLESLVAGYIRENAGDRESGKPYAIVKGKGGGVFRWRDQPAPKPDAAAAK